MEHETIEADPLLAGSYSPADAARLLQVASPKLRGWLNGWSNSTAGPIVDRDPLRPTRQQLHEHGAIATAKYWLKFVHAA